MEKKTTTAKKSVSTTSKLGNRTKSDACKTQSKSTAKPTAARSATKTSASAKSKTKSY